jgi:hypothetical protein
VPSTVRSITGLPIGSLIKPTFERRLTFTRRLTFKKVIYADVFVEVWPVNAPAVSNQSPMIPFLATPFTRCVLSSTGQVFLAVTSGSGPPFGSEMNALSFLPERYAADTIRCIVSLDGVVYLIARLNLADVLSSLPGSGCGQLFCRRWRLS